jgi:hypothetical protein
MPTKAHFARVIEKPVGKHSWRGGRSIKFGSDGRQIGERMTEREVTAEADNGTVIMEVMMILPTIQFLALEEVAHRQNLSMAQLLRLAIADFLKQPQ